MHTSNTHPRSIETWGEQDLYTPWRRWTIWEPGRRRWIKRTTHKRERREARALIAEQLDDRPPGEAAPLAADARHSCSDRT